MLIHATWNGKKAFKLIPVNFYCAYEEAIFIPEQKSLVAISVNKRTQFRMVPQLDTNGDVVKAKTNRTTGAPYKEERKSLEINTEFALTERSDIDAFIKRFAVNASEFSVESILNVAFAIYDENFKPEDLKIDEGKPAIAAESPLAIVE